MGLSSASFSIKLQTMLSFVCGMQQQTKKIFSFQKCKWITLTDYERLCSWYFSGKKVTKQAGNKIKLDFESAVFLCGISFDVVSSLQSYYVEWTWS